jgi:hypothetical protein
MRLDNVPASFDPGPWEEPRSKTLERHDAITEEFEFLVTDPGTVEAAFAEGFRIDAVAAALWAQLACAGDSSLYEAVAKRMEKSLRHAIWEMAAASVDARAEP